MNLIRVSYHLFYHMAKISQISYLFTHIDVGIT